MANLANTKVKREVLVPYLLFLSIFPHYLCFDNKFDCGCLVASINFTCCSLYFKKKAPGIPSDQFKFLGSSAHFCLYLASASIAIVFCRVEFFASYPHGKCCKKNYLFDLASFSKILQTGLLSYYFALNVMLPKLVSTFKTKFDFPGIPCKPDTISKEISALFPLKSGLVNRLSNEILLKILFPIQIQIPIP